MSIYKKEELNNDISQVIQWFLTEETDQQSLRNELEDIIHDYTQVALHDQEGIVNHPKVARHLYTLQCLKEVLCESNMKEQENKQTVTKH